MPHRAARLPGARVAAARCALDVDARYAEGARRLHTPPRATPPSQRVARSRMSRLAGPPMLAVVHLVLCVVVLGWNLYMAGRITSIRATPAPMSALSAVAGLLLVPALFIFLANESLLTSRTLVGVAWAWPAVAVLIALQAIYALTRGLVAPAIGFPIAAYDIVLAIIYVIRYAM